MADESSSETIWFRVDVSAVDLRKQETLIEGGMVYDEEPDNPKTAKACEVKLNSLAKNAL